jgi:uncharacterized membrane protein YphA (DoxX/SURF4 family)/peroxiredoxin
MKTLRNFSRILIATVFIFSGFVKAIDPLGSAYKFSDYFEAFGMDFLAPLALFLAVVLSTAELAIGLSLLMGVVMRITSWALVIFMSFFTVLTLIIALTNPVTDCGCFGDALIITNWQTFWKNVLFMVPTLIIFYGRKRFRPIASLAAEWGVISVFILAGILISVFSYRNLPMFDFRPYKLGTHIPSAMEIPNDAPVDEYETIFIYAKDGAEQEFAVEDIPYSDTSWKYVDRKLTLLKKGYVPPIHDFTVSTYDGIEITDSILSNTNYSFLVVAYNIDKSNTQGLGKINSLAEKLKSKGINFYGMTASNAKSVQEVISAQNLNFIFHSTDDITLKTIIRANPGLVLLKDGVIVDKWHYNNIPEASEFEKGILSTAIKSQYSKLSRTTLGFDILLLISLLSVLALLIKSGD